MFVKDIKNMQSSFENKFASIISKKNSKIYASTKTKISFYLLFFVGAILGIAAFLLVSQDDSIIDASHIKIHINSIFVNCDSVSDYFIETLKISETDLSHIFFIFISGFTYFCFAVAGIIIFAKGFMFGFSVLFLFEIKDTLASMQMTPFIWLFLLLKFIICSIAIYLASETYMFSYDFRSIKQNLSVLKRAPVTYKFIFVFTRTIGSSLIVNFIYCLAVALL